jgi:hypothetical protein
MTRRNANVPWLDSVVDCHTYAAMIAAMLVRAEWSASAFECRQ